MKTIADIAKEKKINPRTLSFRLWEAGIGPTTYKIEEGRIVNQYDHAAQKKITSHLKENPIQRKKGRPKKKGKR